MTGPAEERLRGDAPLLDAWLRFQEEQPTPFTIPGHKQRHDLVGDVVAGDVPLYAGLDTMKLARGVLAEAEARAARLWGADLCRFSVGGSTHGNQALALARRPPRRPGRRGPHAAPLDAARPRARRARAGVGAARGRPRHGLPVGVSARRPRGGARAGPRRPSGASSATRPTSARSATWRASRRWRTGTASRSSSTRRGAPTSASTPRCRRTRSRRGADALVTSAHKTLPAWSQGALVLARTGGSSRARFDAGIEATATTSPSGAILASIDAARALLERDGPALLGRVIEAVAAARARLAARRRARRARRADGRPHALVLVLAGHRCGRQRRRGRPPRPGDAGRDGRPRHPRRDGDPRRHRGGVEALVDALVRVASTDTAAPPRPSCRRARGRSTRSPC